MSGFGDYPFGDGPFGGIAPLPPGRRVGRRPVSWSALPRIYRADITGTRLDDLTPPKATQVVAAYNDDTATKRSATFEVMYPDELRDLEDFVVVELELTRDDGLTGTLPLGHYAVFGRSITMDNTSRRGSLKGYDLTWLLHQATAPASYVVSKGEDPGAAARTILHQLGIPSSLINIPDAGVTLTRDLPVVPGEDWLSFLTDVLAAGTMYQPWVAIDGRITSRKVEDITTVAAVTAYHTADGAKVVPPVTNDPDLARLRNRVTVRKVTPNEGPISYTATVTDASSPVHPDRLAERLGMTTPVILGVSYDESNITSEAEAKALAESRLSLAASFYDKVRIETYPDSALDGHLVMDLDLEHHGEHYYTGRWLQRTWAVRVTGQRPRPVVRRELTRTVRWQ